MQGDIITLSAVSIISDSHKHMGGILLEIFCNIPLPNVFCGSEILLTAKSVSKVLIISLSPTLKKIKPFDVLERLM
jgi:hypothetical protein